MDSESTAQQAAPTARSGVGTDTGAEIPGLGPGIRDGSAIRRGPASPSRFIGRRASVVGGAPPDISLDATAGSRSDDHFGGDLPPKGAARTAAPGPVPPRLRRAGIAAGVVVVALAVVVAVLAGRLSAEPSSPAGAASATETASSSTTVSTLAPTAIYQQDAQSVVVITTEKGSLGTGIVVTADGQILTANHVISDGSAITVTFADGTRSPAAVVSADTTQDIATLGPANLPGVVVPATLGGGVAVGENVVAIGNPLGLAYSTSSGIVSGLDRTNKTTSGTLSGLIQFDAAVNPGSSGGPLLDDHGLVIGVVVSIADPGKDDSWAGIGFAVPIATALAGGGNGGSGPGGPQL